MALPPGTLTLTVEYAQGLKDKDWFGRQEPYCIVRCGPHVHRTRHAHGKSPVWNQTFSFPIMSENNVNIELKEQDAIVDDYLGNASISLVNVRQRYQDRVMAPVISSHGRPHGVLSVSMTFQPQPGAHAAPGFPAYAPPPMYQQAPPPPMYHAPPPPPYYAQPPPPPVYYAPPPTVVIPAAPVVYTTYPSAVYYSHHHCH